MMRFYFNTTYPKVEYYEDPFSYLLLLLSYKFNNFVNIQINHEQTLLSLDNLIKILNFNDKIFTYIKFNNNIPDMRGELDRLKYNNNMVLNLISYDMKNNKSIANFKNYDNTIIFLNYKNDTNNVKSYFTKYIMNILTTVKNMIVTLEMTPDSNINKTYVSALSSNLFNIYNFSLYGSIIYTLNEGKLYLYSEDTMGIIDLISSYKGIIDNTKELYLYNLNKINTAYYKFINITNIKLTTNIIDTFLINKYNKYNKLKEIDLSANTNIKFHTFNKIFDIASGKNISLVMRNCELNKMKELNNIKYLLKIATSKIKLDFTYNNLESLDKFYKIASQNANIIMDKRYIIHSTLPEDVIPIINNNIASFITPSIYGIYIGNKIIMIDVELNVVKSVNIQNKTSNITVDANIDNWLNYQFEYDIKNNKFKYVLKKIKPIKNKKIYKTSKTEPTIIDIKTNKQYTAELIPPYTRIYKAILPNKIIYIDRNTGFVKSSSQENNNWDKLNFEYDIKNNKFNYVLINVPKIEIQKFTNQSAPYNKYLLYGSILITILLLAYLVLSINKK